MTDPGVGGPAGGAPDPREDDAPPLPWAALYSLVLGALAAVIAALAWLTGHWR